MVLGGSKVSDKLGVIENLLDKANRLVIGGGMVYTFLKAKGLEVGTSLLEEDQVETVKGYIERAEQNGVELVLPTDIVVNPVFPKSDEDIAPEVVAADAIPADKMGLDIGPDSQKLFHDKIVDSKTVVWNGPMGVFEVPAFAAAPRPWPRVWSTLPQPVRSPSSAAVIPLPQCVTSASRRMASRTSPPVAVPPSSSSRVRNCRA